MKKFTSLVCLSFFLFFVYSLFLLPSNSVSVALRNIWISDKTSGETANVEHGSVSTIEHGHSDQGTFHFYASAVTASTDYIVIDLSNTTNYPHDYTSIVHIDWVCWDIDATTTPAAAYMVMFGYLDNVDATNGDLFAYHHISGTRTTGLLQEDCIIISPNGWLGNGQHVTGHSSIDDVAFQTDVNLGSTRDPGTADTPSGDGDIATRIIITAGTIDYVLSGGYHTHSPTHP